MALVISSATTLGRARFRSIPARLLLRAQFHGHGELHAIAHDVDRHCVAGRELDHDDLQRMGQVDHPIFDSDDDVAFAQSSPCSWTIGNHSWSQDARVAGLRGKEGAVIDRELVPLLHSLVDRGVADAKERSAQRFAGDGLVDDRVRDVDRNGEAETRGKGRVDSERVDADNAPSQVNQRTAAVAVVDFAASVWIMFR